MYVAMLPIFINKINIWVWIAESDLLSDCDYHEGYEDVTQL